ncbi:MAG: ice-binding family protein [Candidatus Paceibacterota bacterium]|jgi:hypothetical protein
MKNFKKYLIITAFTAVLILGVTSVIKAATWVDLLSADNFAILAGSGITNTGATTIVGDVGSFPTLTQTGFGSVTLTGINHLGDAGTQTAKTDLVTAYNDAAGQPLDTAIVADLGGQTLSAGVYNTASSIAITGTVTLNGGPSDVWIFQAGSTLTTSSGSTSHVSLIGGAQACNVFWKVGSSATIGTGSDFKGNIIAMDSITDDGGSTIVGRLLARNAAITLNNTSITKATCAGLAQGTLHVIKHVVNNNGGSTLAPASTITVSGTTNISPSSFAGDELGTTVLLDAGSYSVDEGAHVGYTNSLSADCSGTITAGGDKTCTITNDDIASNGGGVPYVPPVPPLIEVVKIPNPLSLPAGPGSVMYTYTLRNIGTVPVDNITIVDDTCSPVVRVSGDTNDNSKLDLIETWIHTCTATLSATHTNTVTATGVANGITATDIASATVVVGAPVVPPLIHVTKIPSPLALIGGGAVTYTYTVTNPGTVPLSNVTITDDKCTGLPGRVVGHPGDINNNNLLESNESWSFTCKSNLTKTTTNTATASGDANGLTAKDFAIATVVVSVPGLPKTGFPSNESIKLIYIVGGLFVALLSVYFVKKSKLIK